MVVCQDSSSILLNCLRCSQKDAYLHVYNNIREDTVMKKILTSISVDLFIFALVK